MDLKDLQQLIQLFESSSLAELELEENGRRVRLGKQLAQPAAQVYYAAPHAAAEGAAPSQWPQPPAPATTDEQDQHGLAEGLITIDSPMVGTFYTAGAPADPPFVQVGDAVTPDQTVGIVEAMKIMNEVAAKSAGTIDQVLVKNGEPVEFGQPLFALRPAP